MSSAPRVLLSGICLSQPMGGVRRQALELFPRVTKLLLERGGGLDILVSREGLPKDLETALPGEVGRILTNAPCFGPLQRGRLERAAWKAALGSGDYGLVHTGHFPVPRVQIPTSVMVHDLRDLTPIASPLRRLIARRVLPRDLGRAVAVITVSEAMAREIHSRLPGLEERVHVVGHGSNHFVAVPRSASNAVAPILFFGHLERRRNPMLLIETLARHPDLPGLVFAGSAKHGEDQRLADRARELGLAARVRFLGAVPETRLGSLFASAGCLVIPSLVEGFGIPAIEAARAGLPLAISNAPALGEVCAPGTPTFDVTRPNLFGGFGDTNECAAAIRAALASSALQIETARTFAEGFNWDASAAKLFAIWCASARS